MQGARVVDGDADAGPGQQPGLQCHGRQRAPQFALAGVQVGLQQAEGGHRKGGAGGRAFHREQGLFGCVQVPFQGLVLQLGAAGRQQAAQQAGDGVQRLDEVGRAEGERIGRRRHEGQKEAGRRHPPQAQHAAQRAAQAVDHQQLHLGNGLGRAGLRLLAGVGGVLRVRPQPAGGAL